MWSVTAFGFVLNDILDYEKDKAADVDRPIAKDVLPRSGAIVLAFLLLVIAFGIAATFVAGLRVLVATVLALILYTPAVRHLTLLKGFYVAALCVAPLYYAVVVVHAAYSLLLYAPLVVFIVGRETLIDANEMDEDRRAGLITLAGCVWPICRTFDRGMPDGGCARMAHRGHDVGRWADSSSDIVCIDLACSDLAAVARRKAHCVIAIAHVRGGGGNCVRVNVGARQRRTGGSAPGGCMHNSELSKWYADCLSDDGTAVIIYQAQLHWLTSCRHPAGTSPSA